jgi:hypothetical protein
MAAYQNAHIRRLTPNQDREVGVTVTMEGERTARLTMTVRGASDACSRLRLDAADVGLLAEALLAAAKAMTVPDRLAFKVSSR